MSPLRADSVVVGAPQCPNPAHAGGAVLAIATVTFPDGRFKPVPACSGCAKTAIAEALGEGRPIRLEPIPEAYGICPRCCRSVRLRPASGVIGSHRDGRWTKCSGQGLAPLKQQKRPVQNVHLPESAEG